MKLPEKAHLTFSELMEEWSYREDDLQHLIWTERLRPSVELCGEFDPVYWFEDGERGLGGVPYYCTSKPFCKGFYYLQNGIPEGGKKVRFKSFSKKRDPKRDVHEHGTAGKYDAGIDQGFTEWGEYDEWYAIPEPGYDHLWIKEHAVFLREEIERFEREGKNLRPANEDKGKTAELLQSRDSEMGAGAITERHPDVGGTSTKYKINGRSQPLDAEIKSATKNALEKNDPTSVWNELVKLAINQTGCLLGVVDKEIKYQSDDVVKFFRKRNLAARMKRAKSR
ncbi:MAG: hypothetical protein HYZ65_06570 [Burkholderiales bacterium]|nr:hypothetical protein [Burkholderiales bacterium]